VSEALPLVVGEDGAAPLPWLEAPLAGLLQRHRGHALLLHGAAGAGVLPLALSLAQGWLCESPRQSGGACGRCGSCRLVQSRLHPDLQVLMPETLRRLHEWPLRDDRLDGEDGKRKPSRQIRVDEIRTIIEAVQRTSARGRGKVVVLHPAESLNVIAANALLKTLEEPPDATRLVLTVSDPAVLLPTVRSRCQHHALLPPRQEAAEAWLAGQGVAEPTVLLAACQGLPLDALALSRSGVDASAWLALPQQVAQGRPGVMADWPLPRVVDALQKICHDALALAAQAPQGRYFQASAMPGRGEPAALAEWWQALLRVARHDEHPWNEGLLLDSLLAQAARALRPARASGAASGPGPAEVGRGGRFVTLPP
jgi:DNA polymerase III subunit delta'